MNMFTRVPFIYSPPLFIMKKMDFYVMQYQDREKNIYTDYTIYGSISYNTKNSPLKLLYMDKTHYIKGSSDTTMRGYRSAPSCVELFC